MKKIMVSMGVLLLALSLLLGGCASEAEALDTLKSSQESGKSLDKGELVKMLQEANAYNTPYEKLTTYTYTDFMISVQQPKKRAVDDSKTLLARSFGMGDLLSFHSSFPVQKLTVINEDCVYAEYKLDKDNTPLHAFVVFERSIVNGEDKDSEIWRHYGEIYFAYPELSGEQVSALKGKRIAVQELPFMPDRRFTPWALASGNEPPLLFEETVLLKDGIGVIAYISEAHDSDEVEITDFGFVPYGQSDERYPGNAFVKYAFTPPLDAAV